MVADDVPKELEGIIMKCLAPRSSRYKSARELINDLDSFYRKRSIKLKIKDFSQILKSLMPIG